MSYIEPPARIPFLFRALLWAVEMRLGRKLLANRILTWYPKAFLGSGIMEGLVAHDDPEIPRRLLGLVRIYTSFLVSCPFCIDLNSREFDRKAITEQEIRALQGRVSMDEVPTLTTAEKAALHYVECMCRTPLEFTTDAVEDVKKHFSPRGFVTPNCEILDRDAYATLKRTR